MSPRRTRPPARTLTLPSYERLVDGSLSEAAWQTQVIELLQWRGFPLNLIYHTRDSRGSPPGFPDLQAVRWRQEEFTLVIAEMKREGEQPTGPQRVWLRALEEVAQRVNAAGCGGRMLVGVWRPSDREWIKEVLA